MNPCCHILINSPVFLLYKPPTSAFLNVSHDICSYDSFALLLVFVLNQMIEAFRSTMQIVAETPHVLSHTHIVYNQDALLS